VASKSDFLDELIAERQARNASFPAMVEAARERRRMLRGLAEERARLGLTQTQVAAAMGTSQSSVARIEAGRADVRISSLERYAATLGRRIEWRLSPTNKQTRSPGERRSRTKTVQQE
jgi:transcriptional regulator with XRE-family HTH domain